MRLSAVFCLVLLFGCATAAAQPPATPFAAFAGDWRGEGSFQGAPSEVSAQFAPLFDGAAWALDIDIRFTPPNRDPARFRGRGGYALRAGALTRGSWVDSFGNAYAIAPRFEDGALIVEWGEGQTAGRSVYRVEADGNLVIEDAVRAPDGQYRAFATAELRRAGD